VRPWTVLRPIVVKELRQIRRDPTSLGMLLVLPAAMILLVGYALNFDVKHIPLVIWDQDRTPESRAFSEKFRRSEYFDHAFDAFSYEEVEGLILDNRVRVALVIPPTFGQKLLSGNSVGVQILVDGSDANTAGQAVGYASRITMDYSSRLVTEALSRMGKGEYVPIDFQPRIWYNPDLVSSKFLVPGLIGLILVLTAVVSTALTVVREKELGTMEQIMVSPLRPVQVLLGKTIPYLGISMVAATAILVLGYLLFDIEVRGSILVLYAGIVAIILGALGQGLLISSVTDSQQVAFMMAVLSSLVPSFLLSGFVFPISSMPVVLQILSNVAVTKFFLVVVRGVMLKGVGIESVWPQFLYMFLFAAITIGISSRRLKKRAV
jgi:ABC-2 type transport system permease protein